MKTAVFAAVFDESCRSPFEFHTLVKHISPTPNLDDQFSALTHQNYTLLLFSSVLRTLLTFQICNMIGKVKDNVFYF